MADVLRDTLTRQIGIAAALLRYHLDGLTTEECLWTPGSHGLRVRWEDRAQAWVADWPEEESYAIGPPSAGWTTWHLGYWLTMALDRNFGPGTVARKDVEWPGGAAEATKWIEGLLARWLAAFDELGDAQLLEDGRSRWPYAGRPLADILAWSAVELAKNAAELGMTRFAYAVRPGAGAADPQTAEVASLPSSAK